MSSPFDNFKEFSKAEGAIYTFANNPTLIGILIAVSALVFLYFIYASFSIKKGQSTAKSPSVLGLLIAASALSLAESAYTSYTEHHKPVSQKQGPAQVARSGQGSGQQGLMAAMGMTFAGGTMWGRLRQRWPQAGRRPSRRTRHPNSILRGLSQLRSGSRGRRQTPTAQRHKR